MNKIIACRSNDIKRIEINKENWDKKLIDKNLWSMFHKNKKKYFPNLKSKLYQIGPRDNDFNCSDHVFWGINYDTPKKNHSQGELKDLLPKLIKNGNIKKVTKYNKLLLRRYRKIAVYYAEFNDDFVIHTAIQHDIKSNFYTNKMGKFGMFLLANPEELLGPKYARLELYAIKKIWY